MARLVGAGGTGGISGEASEAVETGAAAIAAPATFGIDRRIHEGIEYFGVAVLKGDCWIHAEPFASSSSESTSCSGAAAVTVRVDSAVIAVPSASGDMSDGIGISDLEYMPPFGRVRGVSSAATSW